MSSATPGANKVSFFILTLTSVPSGKTVSKCPSIATFLLPSNPFIRPSTLPMESIQTLSIPIFSSLLVNSKPFFSSLKGGASISVNSI